MRLLTPREFIRCVGKALVNTIQHDGIEHAGYLAFLGLLAMFPFLVFLVAIIGVIGQGETGAATITSVLDILPKHLTMALRPRIVEIVSGPPQGLLTVSILGAIWTASSAVEGMRTILNRAYHVATPPAYWLRRSLSILQLLIITFMTIAGMMMIVMVPLILQTIEEKLGTHTIATHHEQVSKLIFIVSVGVLFLAVSYIYYTIPNLRQRLSSVAPGAMIVVAGWLGAAYAFTLYLANFDQLNIIYGSLGGVIAALVFFYICNMIFIYGAEFNYQVMETLGVHYDQREEVAEKDGGAI